MAMITMMNEKIDKAKHLINNRNEIKKRTKKLEGVKKIDETKEKLKKENAELTQKLKRLSIKFNESTKKLEEINKEKIKMKKYNIDDFNKHNIKMESIIKENKELKIFIKTNEEKIENLNKELEKSRYVITELKNKINISDKQI